MSTTAVPVPPVLATLIGRLAAAVPGRARATFTELLIGAAATRGGHVTDAILAVGLSRSWTTYYWLLERGRWSWLSVWRALLGALQELSAPPVWHVVIDDTVVERISAGAPGSPIHRNHSAEPNRSRFLRGQGWLCLAAVVERGWRVGAGPLMLGQGRPGTHPGKVVSAPFLLRRLGRRLGRVRLLLDAWFVRARLIEAARADGHTVIGRARRDLALHAVPRPPRRRRRGRPRKYGPRMTRAEVEALPVHRSARILYGKLEVVRYLIAVGTLIAERPPHRTVRAAFPHTAPTSGVWRRTASPAKDEGSAVSGASPPPAPWSAARWSCPSGCAAAASGARGSRHGCGRPRGPDRWSAPRGS